MHSLMGSSALTAIGALLLSGVGRDSPQVITRWLWLALLTAGAPAVGVLLFDLALRRAERHGGIGVVVSCRRRIS